MSSLRGLALLFAVRVGLVASLATKGASHDTLQIDEDLFKLDLEKHHRIRHGQAVKDKTLSLVRTGTGNSKYMTERKLKPFPAAPSWCSAKVTNNLGGMGPDTSAPAELRYSGIVGIETEEHVPAIDIVVKALGSYKPKNPEMNGFNAGTGNEGCFGIINLDDSEGPTSVDLEFSFVNSLTNDPVTITAFEFLLYDIDTGANHTAIESLTVYNDIERYLKFPTAQFTETGTLDAADDSSSVTFTATSEGTGDDNPTDPNNLTAAQIDKTFLGVYKLVQKIHLTFHITGGSGGRNFMFSGQSPTVSTEPDCAYGDCVIWGDPHVLTFDAHEEFTSQHPNPRAFLHMRSNARSDVVNVMEEGQFWIVKSDDVHIQGRYNKRPHQNTTVLGGLAVGGPFLGGNTFIVRPLVGKITWNGEEVLSKLDSEFSNDLIDATYHAGVSNVKDGSKGKGLEVTLPGDVKLIVNRLTRGLAVKISMCARERQDGQCGNFNGNSGDDVQNVLMERVQPLRHREALPWREHLHRP